MNEEQVRIFEETIVATLEVLCHELPLNRSIAASLLMNVVSNLVVNDGIASGAIDESDALLIVPMVTSRLMSTLADEARKLGGNPSRKRIIKTDEQSN